MPDDPVALVALLGAPRSGTTWLQSLIAGDEHVASPQETSLFSRYVAPLDEAWRHSRRATDEEWARRRFTGLPAVLTEEEFVAIVQQFVESSLQAVLRLRPGATVVVEKSPSHSLHPELITKYTPGEVRFVHLVRDGRDVAASLVAASRGWGAAWAPRTISAAANLWAQYVDGARSSAEAGPYREVRYEELRGPNGARVLREVLDFCGVPASDADVRDRLETFSFGRQRESASTLLIGGEAAKVQTTVTEPEGFFRRGDVGGWNEWTTRERLQFDTAAGPQLRLLEYERDDTWLGSASAVRRERARARARKLGARVTRGVGSRLVRAADSAAARS